MELHAPDTAVGRVKKFGLFFFLSRCLVLVFLFVFFLLFRKLERKNDHALCASRCFFSAAHHGADKLFVVDVALRVLVTRQQHLHLFVGQFLT